MNQVEFKFLDFLMSSSLNIIWWLSSNSSQVTIYFCFLTKLKHTILDKLDSLQPLELYFGLVDLTEETALTNRGEWGLSLHAQC